MEHLMFPNPIDFFFFLLLPEMQMHLQKDSLQFTVEGRKSQGPPNVLGPLNCS